MGKEEDYLKEIENATDRELFEAMYLCLRCMEDFLKEENRRTYEREYEKFRRQLRDKMARASLEREMSIGRFTNIDDYE